MTALEVGPEMAADWRTGRWFTKETAQTSHSPGEQLAIDHVMTDNHAQLFIHFCIYCYASIH